MSESEKISAKEDFNLIFMRVCNGSVGPVQFGMPVIMAEAI
jgi:hypothetical protein